MVVRLSETKYEIKSMTRMKCYVHLVYTVIHENALKDIYLRVFYDNETKVSSIHGTLYNAEGIKKKSYSGSDILDISAVSDNDFYTDDRCKLIIPETSVFPFTMEYEYELTRTNIMQFTPWQPQDDINWSVESASLHVTFAEPIRIRHTELNIPGSMVAGKSGDVSDYFWQLKNLPTLEEDPLNNQNKDLLPTVYLAPLSFSYAGLSGEMNSWADVGMFQTLLNKGRNKLSDKTIQRIHELIKDKPDNRSKIEAIYNFMQGRTRYVSVQMGLGDWQPAAASYVDEKGFGDCKALVNYTMSLLEAADIPSYFTLIRAGDERKIFLKDFPSFQFTHVILCVPNNGDSIWLECTNQNMPFGYLGRFTDDRPALLINDNKSKLVHTPAYTIHDNILTRKATVQIDEDGNATADVETTYEGLQFEAISPLLTRSFDDQKKYLEETLEIPGCSVKGINYKIESKPIPVATETLKLFIRTYATKSGDRYFLSPDILNPGNSISKKAEERKTEFNIRHGYSDYDSITYKLPASVKIESLPADKNLTSETGTYQSKLGTLNNGFIYIRKRDTYSGTYAPEQAKPYVEFRRQIAKADREKAVLKILP